MKKKLEADLISIAHRILKLKNKSDINQLYLETQKLYEKLAILKFVEENFDTLKPTIGQNEINAEIESIFDKEETIPAEVKTETPIVIEETPAEITATPEITEEVKAEEVIEEIVAEVPEEVIPEPVIETIPEPVAEITAEPVIEKFEEPVFEPKTETTQELSFTTVNDLKPIPDFKPAFELEPLEENEPEKEEPKAETSSKPGPVTISFEDFGINYADAQFVKVDSFENVTPTPSIPEFKEKKTIVETAILETPAETKPITLNEKLAKGFHIDLNDRIAFTKNLFGNSSEDYSRVLNQLLTFDTYGEAQEFIENMVKPDYNNWEGKDDYAERFLGIVEKKFS
nr:hypothetical protein [Flavobacterium sp. ASV13]